MVLVLRVEKLHEAALLADDEVWSNSTLFVAAVKIASCLLVELHLENGIFYAKFKFSEI